jgi:peptidoglycan/LPS O-acetylase OafA/YrhL
VTRTTTLADRLMIMNGRLSGFDYMRLCMAIVVIASHTLNVCYGPAIHKAVWASPVGIPFVLVLPMFFSLSGFLVAGSLERCKTIISFIGLRLFRLIPALFVEVTLSAIILGPAFTTLPLRDYFASPGFRSYFLNIIGDVHFYLPGVFHGLPCAPTVNMQLWTMPYEMVCYASIAALAVLSVTKRPGLFLAVALAVQVALSGYHTFISPMPPEGTTPGGSTLVVSFLFGIVLYNFREVVPWSRSIFFAATALCIVFGSHHSISHLLPIPASYFTVYLGLTTPKRSKILLSGDYSYGLYLYGFPIQQAVSALFPHWRFWWFNLAVSVFAAGAVACASWWCVENPANKRKKLVFWIEERVLAMRGVLSATRARLVQSEE